MTKVAEHTDLNCYHCHSKCEEEVIEFDDKAFCCFGCKTVYTILDENNLSDYYELNEYAGISLKEKNLDKFSFLNDEDVVEKLIDFHEGDFVKIRLSLPQIHCSSCLFLLENLPKINKGISSSKVNFLKKEAHISYSKSAISLREIVELLATIGYEPRLNFDKVKNDAKQHKDNGIYYKLGLAGFAFGNIMLMSFPEYLGLAKYDNGFFANFFGILNFAIATPVMIYSGSDYFKSAYTGIKQRHLNIDVPIVIGMLALFFRSSFEIFSQTGAGYMDSLVGFIFFLLIGKWFQKKTYDTFSFERDYSSYFPIACNVIQDGKEETRVINKIKAGDEIVIRYGELIPTDTILEKGVAQIDYSFVTGESLPVRKVAGDKIFAGGKQMGEAIHLRVIKEVEQSYLTQLWNDDSFAKKNQNITQTSDFTNKIAGNFTWVILIIAALTFMYWVRTDVALAVNATTAVLIVACPCALALSAPFILGNGMRLLGRLNIYLKNALVLEKLAAIQHIVFDKTGTLTTSSSQEIYFEGEMKNEWQEGIKSVCYQSAHPVSKKVVQYFDNTPLAKVQHFKELIGQGVEGQVAGAYFRIGSSTFMGLPNKVEGVFVEVNGEILGKFVIAGSYRTGLREDIQELKEHYQVSMISGDNDKENAYLQTIFGSSTLVFNQTPHDKLNYIKSLQFNKEHVMMIGDGLNDAGALQQSEIGLSITEDTSTFTPASDIITLGESFQKIPQLMRYAKWSIFLLYGAYIISLSYNIIGLSFAVQGNLTPIVAAIIMPLSSITTVVYSMISTHLTAHFLKL